ncbi:MAG TPA: WG repeat-containing protein [Blastocatellia bacterium]|nr:WG repeat-containing protein [Blastocatellia bacterium]
MDFIFDDAGNFSEGAAMVRIGSRIGYIDRTGKYIWKPTM